MFALNRRLLIVFLASFGPATVGAQNAEDSLIEYLDVSKAVEIAVQDNPNLAEVNTRYRALSEIPSQVGTLPDPVLNFNVMNLPTDTFDRAQEPMTQLQIGFSQSFPFPGKLGLREDAAEHDARAAGHSVDEVRLQLVQKVKSKWWLLYYLDRALETVDSNQALLRQFIAVARTKYETGKGLQQDVLLAQLELSKLLDQEIQLNAIRQNQAIELNILMDRLPGVPIHIASRVSKAMPKLADESVLFNQAALARPLLKRQKTMVEAARSRLNLAKRDYYPDFTVGMAYGDRTGTNPMPGGGARADFLSLMLGIKIPLYAGRK
ncbi:MAG: TolC family protein, partial [Gammaproteobacteria bacterium]|nr:TolC family protein [Gammaproteobacteria bacterium]